MPKKPSKFKITDEMYEQARLIILAGGQRKDISKAWGLDRRRWYELQRQNPELRRALEAAETEAHSLDEFHDQPDPLDPVNVEPIPKKRIPLLIDRRRNPTDENTTSETPMWSFVWGLLPAELRPVFDLLATLHGNKQNVYEIVDKLPTHHAQQIFLFAYAQQCFDTSGALMFMAMTRKDLEKWITTSPDFNEAWRGMAWHKRNMFEMSLIRSCVAGQPASIIFANKTTNTKRGYTEKQPIPADGVQAAGTKTEAIPVEELDLPLETRMALLEAVRKQKMANPSNPATPA